MSVLFLALSANLYAKPEATAVLKDNQGKEAGKAVFTEVPGEVNVALEVSGISEGPHAVHIHDTGKCEAPGFKSAGPHFNPGGRQHGKNNPEGHHAGDLPNIYVKDGKGSLRFIVPDVSLSDDNRGLFKEGGTAIVVHAGPDDDQTDPAGNSGDRILCGVIS